MPEILGPPHRPIHDLNHTRVIHYDNVIYFRVLTTVAPPPNPGVRTADALHHLHSNTYERDTLMSISLSKGGNVSLSKEAPGLTAVSVGLGWDARTTTGTDFDLDASAIMVNSAGKVVSDSHFIFFNNTTSPDGSVEHTGDNLTGECDGDDETIRVNLATVPPEVERIVFPVSVYDGAARSQGFGQVSNAFIRIVNQAGGTEIARFDLTEDASTETAMLFGELYRNNAEWKFRAVGQGYSSGLAGIAKDFGVTV
jgi:tellurium resistance protein TerD